MSGVVCGQGFAAQVPSVVWLKETVLYRVSVSRTLREGEVWLDRVNTASSAQSSVPEETELLANFSRQQHCRCS